MKKTMKSLILKSLIVLFLVMTAGIFKPVLAQDRYAIERAQQAVREKIIRDKGGNVTYPSFPSAQTYASGSRTEVRGTGNWRDTNGRIYQFNYKARVNVNDGRVDKIDYKIDRNSSSNLVPSWAVGTFYGRNPQTGGRIVLTIAENGNVVVDFDNVSSARGYFSNNQISIDGAVSRVTRLNNGIRTTRVDNGETIDYSRNEFGGSGGSENVPSWAIGTFYGRNPQTGERIILSISANGSVRVDLGNGSVYGTVSGDRLTIDGISSRITRLSNGIRTTRFDNGEVIDYYRDFGSGGNVPNWATGTFYARNPQTGGNIFLTISPDGNVTVNIDGVISYGTMYNTTLNINGITSTVTKISGGIRTTRNDNRERIDYRKQ